MFVYVYLYPDLSFYYFLQSSSFSCLLLSLLKACINVKFIVSASFYYVTSTCAWQHIIFWVFVAREFVTDWQTDTHIDTGYNYNYIDYWYRDQTLHIYLVLHLLCIYIYSCINCHVSTCIGGIYFHVFTSTFHESYNDILILEILPFLTTLPVAAVKTNWSEIKRWCCLSSLWSFSSWPCDVCRCFSRFLVVVKVNF